MKQPFRNQIRRWKKTLLHLAMPSPWRQCGTFSLCKSSSANSHPSCKTNAPSSLSLTPAPGPPKQKRKAFQERKWPQRGTQPLVWLNRFQLEVVRCFRSNSNQNVRDWWLITWASFLPTQHFAYTVTRGCLQECSASVKTDSIEWGNLPMLPEHRPSTFHSVWAVSLT